MSASKTPSQSAAQHNLYWRLQLAAHFMQKRADRNLGSDAGISTAQTGVLAVIAKGQDVTQKDVAKALGLNESAVTAMVRRLIALDYVARRKSDKDARAKILTLTDSGIAVQKNVRPPFRKINEEIASALTESEMAQLSDYLERLTRTFE
jgi:DNA-binding MarR family transcriptional regulator